MTPAEPMEEQWLEAAREGDTVAFGHLIKRHEKSVYRSVYRMVRDPDEAAEITQEALVRAWENLSRFRGEAPFAGWLSKIAIYLALNKLRERKKFVRPRDEAQHEAVMDHADSESETPLSALLNRESMAALQKAISELPDEFRAPLLLRLHEEYSYEEIALSLGLPLGTVMSRLYRARERLTKRVRELLGD
jgi:RNA polymerase sigma-70 factor (ECF subfamily)